MLKGVALNDVLYIFEDLTMGIRYQPKGGMCLVCKKRDDNCSGLNFQEMPVIEKLTQFGNDVVIVKCTEFSRGRHLRDPH